MKITKYEHACLLIEEGGDKLVIDPGAYSKSFKNYQNIAAVVVTHVHQDHFDPAHLNAIVQANPNVLIYSTAEVAKEFGAKVTVVKTGVEESVAGFKLKFYDCPHAPVHPSFPRNQNIGVLVNGRLFYPGDSFTKPDHAVDYLALPISGPWLKISEAMDFLSSVKPKLAFGTHDAHSSDIGLNLSQHLLEDTAKNLGCEFKLLETGQSIEV